MSNCCDPASYRRLFNSKEARRRSRGYRKNGLDPMARGILEYLGSRDIAGHDLLEVGGGVGEIQLELLDAGVARAFNVELSSGYEEAAAELMEERGVADRVERRVGDFVTDKDDIDPADIVILNKVVCCYPWMEPMVSAAAAKTGRFLAMTFPRDRWWIRAGVAAENAWFRIRSCGFRGFVHPVEEIEAVVSRAGLETVHRDRNLRWHAVVYERSS